jgi:hypothetical protein
MIQFRDQELLNGRLVLEGAKELYYLGHNLTLRNCTLVVKVPERALVVSRTRFIHCAIECTRKLSNFRWDGAFLQGCRFTGHLRSHDFGEWPSSPGQGGIEDCDFTEARLDGCRFVGCDVRTLSLPRWPCFTLFQPALRWRQLRALPWPGDIGPVVIEGFADFPPTTEAVVYSAPELAKRSGTTPEAIKAVLENLDGVQY